MCFVILKIKQRQHELTLSLVPYPDYFGSEVRLMKRVIIECKTLIITYFSWIFKFHFSWKTRFCFDTDFAFVSFHPINGKM